MVSAVGEDGCQDINECEEGSANCHPHAICVNEIGTFHCHCRPGYKGNGLSCSSDQSMFTHLFFDDKCPLIIKKTLSIFKWLLSTEEQISQWPGGVKSHRQQILDYYSFKGCNLFKKIWLLQGIPKQFRCFNVIIINFSYLIVRKLYWSR